MVGLPEVEMVRKPALALELEPVSPECGFQNNFRTNESERETCSDHMLGSGGGRGGEEGRQRKE